MKAWLDTPFHYSSLKKDGMVVENPLDDAVLHVIT